MVKRCDRASAHLPKNPWHSPSSINFHQLPSTRSQRVHNNNHRQSRQDQPARIALDPECQRKRVGLGAGLLLHLGILVERAFLSVGTLGIVAGVVGVVDAGGAQVFFPSGAIEGDAGMPVCLEGGAAGGTGDRLGIDELFAAGAGGHG
jgi:hypothetical protein